MPGVVENVIEPFIKKNNSGISFGVAENAIELSNYPKLNEHRSVLVNLEINNKCSYTVTCGDNCILNAIMPKSTPITELETLHAAFEIITNGATVRHFAIPGKEPLESPELLLKILHRYYGTPHEQRPGTIGIITSGLMLKKNTPIFQAFPLNWMNLSVDTQATGLRVPQNSLKALDHALELKENGGVCKLGINTILTRDNIQDVIEIGKKLEERGVDQWSVGGMLVSDGKSMIHTLSASEHREFFGRITAEFSGSKMQVLFVTDNAHLDEITGKQAPNEALPRWRTEIDMAPSIRVMALNPSEGYFFRFRWDGQLLKKSDFGKVGLKEGSYGRYSPGKIAELLKDFRNLRRDSTVLHHKSRQASKQLV